MARRHVKIINLSGLSKEDQKNVYQGLYKFQDTHGVSLYEILLFFKENNYLIDWVHYINEAISFGKRIESIRMNILMSIEDTDFIPESEREDFENKLNEYLNVKKL